MTTDQRCVSCSHSVRDHEHDYCNVIGCECLNWGSPTPTSSLEEAWWDYDRFRAGEHYPTERSKRRGAVEAAARAEVIREVEALFSESMSIAYDAGRGPLSALEIARARLRALSQGGEGKA